MCAVCIYIVYTLYIYTNILIIIHTYICGFPKMGDPQVTIRFSRFGDHLQPDIPAEAITRMASKAKVVPQTVRMGLGKLLAIFGSFWV